MVALGHQGFTSKARARLTWSGSAIAAWISSGRPLSMKWSTFTSMKRASARTATGPCGPPDPADGRAVDLPPGDGGDLGLQVQHGVHRHGPHEVGLQPPGHRDDAQQPVQGAERLVERGGEHPAVGETGCTLVRGLDGELGGDAHALARPGLQVESVRLAPAASETVLVVRAEELAGCGRVRVPDRRGGVGRGRQRCVSSTHSRRPYPRGYPPVASWQA